MTGSGSLLGYEFFAKRQLVTIFSAPNYCGEFENAGAMMSVDETLMCSFQVSGAWAGGRAWGGRMEWVGRGARAGPLYGTLMCSFEVGGQAGRQGRCPTEVGLAGRMPMPVVGGHHCQGSMMGGQLFSQVGGA